MTDQSRISGGTHVGDVQEPNGDLIAKGKPDPLGDTVHAIYVQTSQFTIYTARLSDEEFCRLRYCLSSSCPQECKKLRERLGTIIGPIAMITSTLCGSRPRLPWPAYRRKHFEARADRCAELMAKAKQLAFEGKVEQAEELLEGLLHEVQTGRDSKNRMRYILANLTALLAFMFAWAVLPATEGVGLFKPILTGKLVTATPTVSYQDVLLLGAIGAFFAVSIGVKKVKVQHSVTITEMIYTGTVRIMIGVIAALVMILLMLGDFLPVSSEKMTWAMYLFGFMAGFSEMLIPDALKDKSPKLGSPKQPDMLPD
ncbi:hypothetical protein [Amaricoccus macauensis]|uniref:hypothetical protein n=1 Tax=Amaricoccus macauensis TaxID=57001 RepID=UPI003C7BA918